jgi:hypothetical protein
VAKDVLDVLVNAQKTDHPVLVFDEDKEVHDLSEEGEIVS